MIHAHRFTRTLGLLALAVLTPACSKESKPSDDKKDKKEKTEEPSEKAPPKSDDLISEDVKWDAGDRAIHGTITRPKGEEKYPALMLIAGSGPTDRNWNSPLMPGKNGSGRLVAEAVTRAGFVVLRYDKLGTGKTAATPKVSFDDYEAEQAAGFAFLRKHASVDATRVFLAGHSEGGTHAIRVASKIDPAPAGLVLLASAGRNFRDILYGQIEAQYAGTGMKPEAVTKVMKPFGEALDDIIAGKKVDPTKASDVAGVQSLVAAFAVPQAVAFGRVILAYDPAEGIKSLKMPILVVNGEKDVQVSPEKDAKRLDKAARDGGNGDVTLKLFPDANHVLKHEKLPFSELSPGVSAKYNGDTPLDKDAANGIVEWLKAHAAKK